jgi:hypothetical protein
MRRQKEEKTHDEKMSVANAKIKQAGESLGENLCLELPNTSVFVGQTYEKKAKKRAV